MILGFITPIANAIMTTAAIAGLPRHCTMVEHNLRPVRSVMTRVTGLVGRNMVWPLAYGNCVVVTRLAGGRGLSMGKR